MPMREVDAVLLRGGKLQSLNGKSIYPFEFFFADFVGKYVKIRVQEIEK